MNGLKALLIAVALAATGCGGDEPPEKVDIKGFAYTPKDATVQAGRKLTFTNQDGAKHTATMTGAFDTGTLEKGQRKVVTLDKPGSYSYVCEFHPFMKGKLTVE